MKKVLFIAAIYTLIIHQCTKKAKVEIATRTEQKKIQPPSAFNLSSTITGKKFNRRQF